MLHALRCRRGYALPLALAAVIAQPAIAATTGDVSLSNFAYQISGLQPGSGPTPYYAFLGNAFENYEYGHVDQQIQTQDLTTAWLQPESLQSTQGDDFAIENINANGVSVSASTSDPMGTFDADAMMSATFTGDVGSLYLSAQSELVMTADYHAALSVDDTNCLVDGCQSVNAYIYFEGLGNPVQSLLLQSGKYSGSESLSEDGVFMLTFINDTDRVMRTPLQIFMSVSGADYALPVPEPTESALLVAGLLAIGVGVKRTHSGTRACLATAT